MHWWGPTFHRCCGVAIPAGARRKRDVAACDTATDASALAAGTLAMVTMQRFPRSDLTTVLTAVGAQTANRINDFSQLSLAGRSIPQGTPAVSNTYRRYLASIIPSSPDLGNCVGRKPLG